MTREAGVWIDHRKAVLVVLTEDGVHVETLLSTVEKHPERGGDSPLKGPYEARQVPADDKRQRALTGELHGYYDAVIVTLGDFRALLIFGPGEAKGELQKRLVQKHPTAGTPTVETADKMTVPQIVAKVLAHFGHDTPRR